MCELRAPFQKVVKTEEELFLCLPLLWCCRRSLLLKIIILVFPSTFSCKPMSHEAELSSYTTNDIHRVCVCDLPLPRIGITMTTQSVVFFTPVLPCGYFRAPWVQRSRRSSTFIHGGRLRLPSHLVYSRAVCLISFSIFAAS